MKYIIKSYFAKGGGNQEIRVEPKDVQLNVPQPGDTIYESYKSGNTVEMALTGYDLDANNEVQWKLEPRSKVLFIGDTTHDRVLSGYSVNEGKKMTFLYKTEKAASTAKKIKN